MMERSQKKAVWYKEGPPTQLAICCQEDILSQLACSGPRGEIESIPLNVLHGTSTNRRHSSTQQTVRSTADPREIIRHSFFEDRWQHDDTIFLER